MNITSIQIAARELHEAAARFDILRETDDRYGSARERYELAKERMIALLERDAGPVANQAKRAA